MNQSRSLGIVLLVIGILFFSYAGVVTHRTRDKVIDAGPIQVTADKTHKAHFPSMVGAVFLVGGIVLLATSSKRVSLSSRVWSPIGDLNLPPEV